MNKPLAATVTPALVDLAHELRALVEGEGSGSGTLPKPIRAAMVALLKRELSEGRAAAEAALKADGRGTQCARRLSDLQDEVLRAIYALAADVLYKRNNPTAAERMSVIAVGGYGRQTLGPGSDVDLLFLLPYKQTPWGESVVEFILYLLWDLGLKVGHATRSIDECIRIATSDMTVRTALLDARYLCGDTDLCATLIKRFDTD